MVVCGSQQMLQEALPRTTTISCRARTEFNFIFRTGADINVLDTSSGLLDGPGGAIDDSTLDGGTHSVHGYTSSALPATANAILSTAIPSQVVAS